MKLSRRPKSLVEPPAVMLTDLAFNLVIFFVVCASTDPESGRKQPVPRSSKDQAATAQASQNIEVSLERTTIAVNSVPVLYDDLEAKLKSMLAGKTRPEEQMVVVKSTRDTPYQHWIRVTSLIEKAGGIVALQLEESKEVVVP